MTLKDLNFPAPISEETNFYGRDRVWREVQRCITGPDPRPVILLGERLIGKTSLLQISAKRMAKHSDCALIPIILPHEPLPTPYYLLTTSIYQNLQIAINHLSGSDHTKEFVPGDGFIDDLRDLLSEKLACTFVICIDSFDYLLQPLIHDGAEDEIQKIIWVIDSLIRERQSLGINMFITLSRIPDVLGRSNIPNTILESSRILEIPPLLDFENREMVQRILEPHIQISTKVIDRIHHYSGGNPYTTKLILDTLLQQDEKSISPAHIDRATKLAATNYGHSIIFQNIIENTFSVQERALALLMTRAARPLEFKELKLLGSQFITAANSLVRRAYLCKNDQGFYWQMHFIPEWLHRWDRYDEEMELLNIPDLLDTLSVEIWIDKTTRKVFFRQEPIPLSGRQYEILECLCIHAGKLVTYEQMSNYLWSANDLEADASINAINMAIVRLRKAFHDSSRSPRFIETVHAQGYILRRAGFISEYQRL